MIELTLPSGTQIKQYSSIKEMPVKLHNLVQSYLLQDSGIGSDIESIDDHFKNMDSFLSSGQLEDAIIERNNLRYNFFMMLENLDFKSPAFACYIHSINDVVIIDYSDEALMKMIIKLSDEGLTFGMMEEQLYDLKKNFNLN